MSRNRNNLQVEVKKHRLRPSLLEPLSDLKELPEPKQYLRLDDTLLATLREFSAKLLKKAFSRPFKAQNLLRERVSATKRFWASIMIFLS